MPPYIAGKHIKSFFSGGKGRFSEKGSLFNIQANLIKITSLKEENRRHLVIAYFKALEKTVPDSEIDHYWNELMQRLEQEKMWRRTLFRLYVKVACAVILVGGIVWISY